MIIIYGYAPKNGESVCAACDSLKALLDKCNLEYCFKEVPYQNHCFKSVPQTFHENKDYIGDYNYWRQLLSK